MNNSCFRFIVLYLLFFNANILYGQNKLIDSSIFNRWPNIQSPLITSDGKYVLYIIENISINKNEIIIRSISTNWLIKLTVPSGSLITEFTPDNKRALFLAQGDSLCIMELGKYYKYIPQVNSFSIPKNGNGEWVAIKKSNQDDELLILNLNTQKSFTYKNVNYYHFSNNGKSIIIKQNSMNKESIVWLNLNDGYLNKIWEGENAGSLTLDDEGGKLAFLSTNRFKGEKSVLLIYYNYLENKLDTIIENKSNDLLRDFKIERINFFLFNAEYLIVSLKEKNEIQNKADDLGLKVWNYMDTKLQSQQIKELYSKSYLATIQIKQKNIVRLQEDNENLNYYITPDMTSDLALFTQTQGDCGKNEDEWNSSCIKSWFLINIKSGTRKRINAFDLNNQKTEYKISPLGKYILYYKDDDYYCYNTSNGEIRNISKNIKTDWNVAENLNKKGPLAFNNPRGIAGWFEGDEEVLLYDHYDIWRVDLTGDKAPTNVTNGYGFSHNTVFSIIETPGPTVFNIRQTILLSAFNILNKQNGFFKKKIGVNGNPDLLTMGPYIYYLPLYGINNRNGLHPIKAAKSNTYIVRRESSTESPNYSVTNDFIKFKSISNIYPEKGFNWLKSELHTWTMPDGKITQGILYKPQDFDSTKKYPIIFDIYEKKSDILNAYIKPEPLCNGCSANTPLLVSNGYLVFMPDINFELNNTGESALNAILSATNYIQQFPWVDTSKMGIQGCSFGGYETNYIITHSNIFAAACTAAGVSDLISNFGTLREDSYSYQGLNQYRFDKMIWESPDLFVKNSPVFWVNKVTTPLLLFHTTYDEGVNFNQAIEFFTALRRLGKRVWLLEYSNGNHGVHGLSAEDFSIRMFQFFDHYLKLKQAPIWMTQGIKAKDIGVNKGL